MVCHRFQRPKQETRPVRQVGQRGHTGCVGGAVCLLRRECGVRDLDGGKCFCPRERLGRPVHGFGKPVLSAAHAKAMHPHFKRYFIAGLILWTPLSITIWVITWIFDLLDSVLPIALRSETLFGIHVPGFGVLLVLLLILVTGFLAANLIGQKLVEVWEATMRRIPLVRSIYSSVKQVSDTILSPNGQAFRQAVLIQYPREGAWTIAFQTGTPSPEVAQHLPQDCVSVYVPTTPNPTSGFFLMVPRSDLVELSIGVDAALKYVVSMGTVPPSVHRPKV